MSQKKSSTHFQRNWGVKEADPGQLDWLSIPENETVSIEGVDQQESKSCSADTRNPTDVIVEGEHSVINLMDEDPGSIGHRLRAARELRGWSCEDVGSRLKLQARLIRRIEEDDYSGIAHAVYLRGYLNSYARLMNLPLVLTDQVVEEHGEQAPLVSTGRVSRSRYLVDRYSVSATYLILTALVIGPAVWLATHGGLEQNLARTVMLDRPGEAREASVSGVLEESLTSELAVTPAVGEVAEQPLVATPLPPADSGISEDTQPIIASMAPFTSAPGPKLLSPSPGDMPVAGKHSLILSLSQSSWVEVTAANGDKLEYGLLEAGVTRSYSSDGAISVRIGNAQGAEIVADGKSIDLAPFRRANVASLRVFDGSKLATDIDS